MVIQVGLSIVLWYFSIQPTTGPDFPIGPFFDQHSCQIVQQNDEWLGEANSHAWSTTPCAATNASPPQTQLKGNIREVPPEDFNNPYHLPTTPKGVK